MKQVLRKITKTQFATIILLIAYGIWEYAVYIWSRTMPAGDPIIRVDLVIIYPVLVIFIIISLVQMIKGKKE